MKTTYEGVKEVAAQLGVKDKQEEVEARRKELKASGEKKLRLSVMYAGISFGDDLTTYYELLRYDIEHAFVIMSELLKDEKGFDRKAMAFIVREA